MLKVAEIELNRADKTNISCLEELISWMTNDFFFAGPSTLYACLYFAPNSPKGDLLKKLRSTDRSYAIKGVKNAAWDATYLSEFAKRMNEPLVTKTRLIFASADKQLSKIAKTVVSMQDLGSSIDAVAVWWPPEEAQVVASLLWEACQIASNKTQVELPAIDFGNITDMIKLGESRVQAARI